MEHNNKKIRVDRLCRSVKFNQTVTWHTREKVAEVPLYIAGHRTLQGLLIVVATENPDSMIEDYYKRWDIETLFRLGLDMLRRALKNKCAKGDQITFLVLLNVLSRT